MNQKSKEEYDPSVQQMKRKQNFDEYTQSKKKDRYSVTIQIERKDSKNKDI